MSFLAAVEAVGQRILCLVAVQMGVLLRAALVAKSSLGGWAISEQVVPGAAFQASLLVSLGVLELGHGLLFFGQLLLDPSVLFLLYAIAFLLRVNYTILWIVECLLELGELCIDASAFGLVLLGLLLLFLGLQSRDLLPDLLQRQVDFLHHTINFIIMHPKPPIIIPVPPIPPFPSFPPR